MSLLLLHKDFLNDFSLDVHKHDNTTGSKQKHRSKTCSGHAIKHIVSTIKSFVQTKEVCQAEYNAKQDTSTVNKVVQQYQVKHGNDSLQKNHDHPLVDS